MSKVEKILVNGKTYQVQKMGVIDTLTFHLEVSKYLGGTISKIMELSVNSAKGSGLSVEGIGEALKTLEPEQIMKLQKKVFAQVIAPDNRFLADALAVETWFSKEENQADVWEVLIKGTITLLGEYLPNSITGIYQKVVEKTA